MTWIGTSSFQTTCIMKLKNHPVYRWNNYHLELPHFWRKNPAIETVETLHFLEVIDERRDPDDAEVPLPSKPPKKRCENSEKRMGGKGWKLGDFLVSGMLKGKLPGAKQRFWLGEWVKLTEIDQLIDLQTNQSIVFQLIGSTTRLRELHNREGDAKSNLLASYSCWVFGKSGQIWKDSVPLNIHYMLFPPKWIGIINLSLNHLENDHDEQLHPCNPVHLGAQILARISNFADLLSSNEWRTEGNTFKIWFQKTKNPFWEKNNHSYHALSCFSNFHMWLPRMASEILRLSLLTSTVGGVRFPPAGGETSSNDELVGLRLWWRTWGARVLEEVDW